MTSATTTTQTVERTWSEKQEAIFDEAVNGTRHLTVVARAGTGKTTTIVEMVKRILTANPNRIITVCAFNKSIAEELTSRFVGYPVVVKTLHAIGLACVKRFWPDVKVSFTSDRQNDLAQRACGPSVPDDVKKVVAKLCTKGREIVPHATQWTELVDVAYRFECEAPETWSEEFPIESEHDELGNTTKIGIAQYAVDAMAIAAAEKPVKTGIDGSDMIFLPVRNGWLRKSTDDVVVDEAQDMTAAQLEIAIGIARGRIMIVGDDRQAIYAFRGADSNGIDRLSTQLDSVRLPLNITYRCANAIVCEAQRIVGDFLAGPTNPEGSVEFLDREKLTTTASAGDFILSRVNAPLVSIAMSLLRSGKRTRIAGRDIGAGLRGLIRKMKARTVPELLTKITAWQTRELARLDAKFPGKSKIDNSSYTSRRDAILDQAEMLTSLTDGAPNVNEVESRIDALFTDDGLGQAGMITCSSVHRSKGLETDRVFILSDTLRSNNDEENNIAYVAITRAKTTLVYVSAPKR